MSSHVASRKMGMSKLLFIALVALYVVFARVSANDGDDVVVDAEGEGAVAENVEGGDQGESQAGADVVRSQMGSTHAPTASGIVAPKTGLTKGKIAIIVVVILLAVGLASGLLGNFVIAPRISAHRAKGVAAALTDSMADGGFSFGDETLADQVTQKYVKGADGGEQEAIAALGKLKEAKIASEGAKDAGEFFIKTGSASQKKAITEALGLPAIPEDDKADKAFYAQVVPQLVKGNLRALPYGSGLKIFDATKVKAAPEKTEKTA